MISSEKIALVRDVAVTLVGGAVMTTVVAFGLLQCMPVPAPAIVPAPMVKEHVAAHVPTEYQIQGVSRFRMESLDRDFRVVTDFKTDKHWLAFDGGVVEIK